MALTRFHKKQRLTEAGLKHLFKAYANPSGRVGGGVAAFPLLREKYIQPNSEDRAYEYIITELGRSVVEAARKVGL